MKIALHAFLAVLLLAGCSSNYDPVVATGARELAFRTTAIVADGKAGRLSQAESRHYLKHSRALVRSLRARTDEAHLTADELTILNWLDAEYGRLLAERRPLRGLEITRVANTLYTLQDLRPIPDNTPTIAIGGSAIDDTSSTDTTDTTSRNSKDCDKDHHHHDDRDCGCKHDHR